MELVTISIDRKIWKKLARIKLDKGFKNYNEVLKMLLEKGEGK